MNAGHKMPWSTANTCPQKVSACCQKNTHAPNTPCAIAALLIGYARCSTDQQDLTAQRDGLEPRGIRLKHGLPIPRQQRTQDLRDHLRQLAHPRVPGRERRRPVSYTHLTLPTILRV